MTIITPLVDRLEARTVRVKNDGPLGDCWEWRGARRGPNGYGQITVVARTNNRKKVVGCTHRIAWQMFCGPIPKNACVLHRCDNRICWRPEHLFLGTKADNSRDMALKERSITVNQLSRENAFAILWRHAAGETQSALAKAYDVTSAAVWKLVNRVSWPSLSMVHD